MESVEKVLQVRKTMDDRDVRPVRLVVKGLPESDESEADVRREEDIRRIVDTFDIERKDIIPSFHTGKKNEERPRFVILRIGNKERRDAILKKNSRIEGQIKMRPDLSPEDRNAEKEFFRGLGEAKKNAEPGTVFRVRGPPATRWFETVRPGRNR